jgi:transcriptional regulator with PAS, ATPase and Fis domain
VATNKKIEEAVRNGRFREDLYYRLNVVNILIPPLRDRKEEIPILTEHFLNKFARKYNKKVEPISGEMMEALLRHPWFGNIRELENIIQRYIVFGTEESILKELTEEITSESPRNGEEDPVEMDHLEINHPDKGGGLSLKEVHREAVLGAESEVISKALAMTHWNRKKAAHMLNISYKTLLYKIQKYGIDHQSVPSWNDKPASCKNGDGQPILQGL